ncbi:MAG: hypothetical protein JOZ09_08955 [Pseudonocardiales bacterium]|nr:hypothetical protein [Pseudonocardiales bacterium]
MIKKCFQKLLGKHRAAQQLGEIQTSRCATPEHYRRTSANTDWMVTKNAATTVAGNAAAAVTRKPTATTIATSPAIATITAIATVTKKRATALTTRTAGATGAAIAGSKGSSLSCQEQASSQDARGKQNAQPPLDAVIHEDLHSLIL